MKKKLKKIIQDQLLNFKNKYPSISSEIPLAVTSAILITISAMLFAELLYSKKPILKRGYKIEIGADGKAIPKKVEKPIDLSELMKLADIDRGAKIFKKCASCHNILKGEGAKVGPNLNGVVGRMKGSMIGFIYSSALKEKGGIWDRESINQFITKPKEYISGTKMAFPGLKKPQDRADVILYLEKQSK